MTNISPCPVLATPLADVTTERMLLRRFLPGDAHFLAPAFANRGFWEFPYGRGFTLAETEDFVAARMAEWDLYGLCNWVAIDRGSERAIGYVGISVPHFLPEFLPTVEVGWRFDPEFWGMGLASEGAAAALDQAFGPLGLDKVCSAPQSENTRSVKVCERLGMTFGQVAVSEGNAKRGPVEVSLYWITREQWLERQAQRDENPPAST
jgi:RimJ/RimL family protein N-acetyltransferase